MVLDFQTEYGRWIFPLSSVEGLFLKSSTGKWALYVDHADIGWLDIPNDAAERVIAALREAAQS